MTRCVTELPEIIIKSGNMIPTAKLKTLAVILVLLLYVYVLSFIKTFYLKSKRLDRILDMTLNTEKRMKNVHNMDQQLARQMSQLDKL